MTVIARGRTSLHRVIVRAGIPLYRVIARAGIPAHPPPRPFHSPLLSLPPLALSWFWPSLAWTGTCRGLARPSTRRGLGRLGLVCYFSGPGSSGHLSGLRLGLVWHFTGDFTDGRIQSPRFRYMQRILTHTHTHSSINQPYLTDSHHKGSQESQTSDQLGREVLAKIRWGRGDRTNPISTNLHN